MNNLRHIKRFKNYIAEQEFSEFSDPSMEGGQQAPKPKSKEYSFIFIDKDSDKKDGYRYPDGSFSKNFNTYKISEKDLDDWITSALSSDDMSKNEVSVKSKALKEYIAGKKPNVSPDLKKVLDKFKNEITSDMHGTKVEDTEVVFSNQGDPSTNSIEITFIEL
jgi:hypothetical protein